MDLADHPAGYRQVTLLLFDGSVLIVPYPPCSDLFRTLAFPPDPALVPATTEENYYQMFFAMGAALQPRTYLEIGTRFGYSLVAVARGAPKLECVVSCDLETYDNPHALSSQTIAERNLRASGYRGEAIFIADDSRRLAQHVAGKRFDLILIDGDHSYEGCRCDILTCYPLLAPGGVLMVDDLDIPAVFSAVMDSVRELEIAAHDRCFVPTKHGLYLVRRFGSR
jgi:predicted O-methyltransferase YrrM